MFYRAIGLMSGSSLDGLDIVFAEFTEVGGKWSYEIKAADCYTFEENWNERLKRATDLSAYDYLLLHTSFGKYLGEQVNRFIEDHNLHHQVQLIASHGHTTFHAPKLGMTAQLGDGAAIAATTGINVVSDLRAVDVAFGGQGAPIVPMGEKLLFADFPMLLNIGGIANLSYRKGEEYIAFDICAANRVLNMLAAEAGKSYDEDGNLARSGKVLDDVLLQLNQLDYYSEPHPKSLANQFGTDEVFPLLPKDNITDSLRTYVEHIAVQISKAVNALIDQRTSNNDQRTTHNKQLLITGGGAHNKFLVERIQYQLSALNIEVIVPEKNIVDYKEALIMALLGILRWREQNTTLSSVTGAMRDSIGGAVWIGQEA
jgi:anhydro-N-acetylmuramic acid kinase